MNLHFAPSKTAGAVRVKFQKCPIPRTLHAIYVAHVKRRSQNEADTFDIAFRSVEVQPALQTVHPHPPYLGLYQSVFFWGVNFRNFITK
jgi:hypothetical protein